MKTYLRFLRSYLQMDKELLRLSLCILPSLVFQVVIIVSFQISYKEIFDAASQREDFQIVLDWIYVILTASVLRVLMGMLSDYLVGLATLKVFSGLRYKLFHHLEWLSVRFYQGIKMGDLISRYSHDLQQSEMVTRQFLPNLIRSVILGVLSAVILFYFDWRLALFAICIFPFVILGARLFSTQAANATRRNQVANAELSSMIEEVATQHLLVQAFNLQDNFLRKFERKIKSYKTDFMKGIFLRGLVSRTSIFGLTISEVLVFSLGAIMTYHGMMTIGTLFGFFALIWNLSGAVDTISQYLPSFIEAGASMERIQALLDEKTDEPVPADEKKGGRTLAPLSEMIRFDHVSLSDLENKEILNKVSIEIPIGKSVALVGPTGCGKTTILSMLMGFYYPTSGTLTLDGQNIEGVSQTSLRSQIGVVFQQSPLFNTTIRENIRLGRENATDEEVENAAKAAEIHDFIMKLPQGYDTPVLEYGSNLSGGEKQRLAIARVYLRRPSLILLDEPTSALDLIVEGQINSLIAKLAKERTVVLATHRLASLQDIDYIYVVDKGEIVEHGTHEELVRQDGLYHILWKKQHGVVLDKEGNKPHIEIGFLRNIPLLSDMPDQILGRLAAEFYIEWANPGQTVFKKGSGGDKFYLIARGRVELRNPDQKPEDSLIGVLEDGDYFGEAALVRDSVRTEDAVARGHCIFLVLHSSQFDKIISADPEVKKSLEKKLAQRNHSIPS
ncbi:MAG: ATP-binding cassette domain-containing protein [Verrucomicrobia bacterium]|nr:ATP-binding cassette domain-containing protein [Verrucomicrobiota bacterium]